MATPVVAGVAASLGQTATPTPGVGPGELVDALPVVVRAAWFLAGAVGVLLVGWYAVEPAVSRIVRRRNRGNPTVQEAITRYVRVVVAAVAVLVGATVAGYGRVIGDSAIVVAALTLAVGVAGQTVIGSLVSGLVLVFDPEFSVGNYIEWDDGEGTVESITLRVTRVQSPDGELVTIPNTMLTSQTITRPYGRKRYRVVERVGVDYESDVDEAITQIRAAAGDVDEIMRNPGPEAFVGELDDGAVVIRAHYWLDRPRPGEIVRVRSAFARAVRTRLENADVSISPATQHEFEGRITVEEGD